jgi:hypothetical protein
MQNQNVIKRTTVLQSAEIFHDNILLPDIGYTTGQFSNALLNARQFLAGLALETPTLTPNGFAAQSTASNRNIKKDCSFETVRKIGSRLFVKRRPEDITPFINYIESVAITGEPLLFRVGFGPVKNINLGAENQNPDAAEYLTLVQLARLMHAVSGLYPFGVRAQIVPDDLRGASANRSPDGCAKNYIQALQDMVTKMGLGSVMTVENGQERLYKLYNVEAYRQEAVLDFSKQLKQNSAVFAARWAKAQENARANLPPALGNSDATVKQAAQHALRVF